MLFDRLDLIADEFSFLSWFMCRLVAFEQFVLFAVDLLEFGVNVLMFVFTFK